MAMVYDISSLLHKAATHNLERWLSGNRYKLQRVVGKVRAAYPVTIEDGTVDEILAQVKHIPPTTYYRQDRRRQIVEAFRENGLKTTLVTTGGFKLEVGHKDGTLIYIKPTAKSASGAMTPLEMVISVDGPGIRIQGHDYDLEYSGSGRARESIMLAAKAFERGGGDIATFYQWLGARQFCAICGAGLSDPLSKDRGIGPECIKSVGSEIRYILDKEERAKRGQKLIF